MMRGDQNESGNVILKPMKLKKQMNKLM